MTQPEWRDIFLGDIQAIKSALVLRRWANAWAEDIKRCCPAYADVIRAAYVERLKELSEGK